MLSKFLEAKSGSIFVLAIVKIPPLENARVLLSLLPSANITLLFQMNFHLDKFGNYTNRQNSFNKRCNRIINIGHVRFPKTST